MTSTADLYMKGRHSASRGDSAPAGSKRLLHRLFIYLFWAVMILALLNYGANDPATVALVGAFTFALLPALIWFEGISRNAIGPLTFCSCFLSLVLFWICFQIFPGFSTLQHTAWVNIRELVGPAQGTLSITPGEDLVGFLKVAVPFGVFANSMLLFRDDAASEWALRCYALAGGAVAGLSIVQFSVFPSTLLFGEKPAYLDSLTAFFVNRNTAATFFGLIALLLFALCWNAATKITPRADGGKGDLSCSRSGGLNRCYLYMFLFLLTIIALMLTRSRAGIGSSMFSLVCLGFLLVVFPGGRADGRRRHTPKWQRAAAVGAVLLGVVALLMAFGERVLLRGAVKGLEDGRFCIMPGLLHDVLRHLPFGSGLASFQDGFAEFRDPTCGIIGIFDKAHNFYLEGLITLGVLFPALVTVFVVYNCKIFVLCLRRRKTYRYAGSLGLSMMTLLSIHSSFDFSLQIPGLAMVYAALLAPLVTIAVGRRAPPPEADHGF